MLTSGGDRREPIDAAAALRNLEGFRVTAVSGAMSQTDSPATPAIAIVDDDEAVRVAVGRLLRSFDYRVELYASGPDLLDAPCIDALSCIISDVQMPTMSGFAICQALRARGCEVPVILMTAFAGDNMEQNARAAGATQFLSKPFDEDDLIHCIERALSGC
ncbi:response regulator transcription factor [Cupriavidus plantarum]|nr:response regulator [Cupriavidus plantarum]